MRTIWLVICFLVAFACAAETVDSAAVSPAEQPSRNIPLPHQTAYFAKGLSVGIGGGIVNPTEECDCLGVWQGQVEYFYTGHFSMGADVRFFGGNLDSDKMLMYQRYRVVMRFHLPFDKFDIYLSPMIGMENTNLEEFRDEWKNRKEDWWHWGEDSDSLSVADTVEHVENCEKMFSLDGFSGGLDLGFGIALSKYVGLTGSALYEYNFSGAQLLTLSPGIDLNLQQFWGWSSRRLRSTWLSVEFMAQRFFNRGVKNWLSAVVLGIQIGV